MADSGPVISIVATSGSAGSTLIGMCAAVAVATMLASSARRPERQGPPCRPTLDVADNWSLYDECGLDSKRCSLRPQLLEGLLRNCLQNNDFGRGQGVLYADNALPTNKPNTGIEGFQIQGHVVLCQFQESA